MFQGRLQALMELIPRWAQSFLGNEVLYLPLQPAIVVLFVSHLYLHNYASSTVTSYLSAIGYTNKLAGVNDPTELQSFVKLLKVVTS